MKHFCPWLVITLCRSWRQKAWIHILDCNWLPAPACCSQSGRKAWILWPVIEKCLPTKEVPALPGPGSAFRPQNWSRRAGCPNVQGDPSSTPPVRSKPGLESSAWRAEVDGNEDGAASTDPFRYIAFQVKLNELKLFGRESDANKCLTWTTNGSCPWGPHLQPNWNSHWWPATVIHWLTVLHSAYRPISLTTVPSYLGAFFGNACLSTLF